jgi:nucleoside-diphosphate-sugar epimerase
MRIGVTGAHGFIGSHVVKIARDRGYDVSLFDKPADVTSLGDVYSWVERLDAVINLAGILGTAETIGHDKDCVAVNVIGALNVADACELRDVPLVQIGTGHKGTPNVYAITKACAEDLLLARAQWQGQRINVVRAYHAYGPGQKAPAPWGTATVTKIVPNFVCRALAGLPLPIHGDGSQLVDLVHVRDVAHVLVDAVDGPWGEVVEAGTGEGRPVVEAAQDIIDFVGGPSHIEHVPMPPGFTPGGVVATKPASWSVPWPFGLLDTVAYYRTLLEDGA